MASRGPTVRTKGPISKTQFPHLRFSTLTTGSVVLSTEQIQSDEVQNQLPTIPCTSPVMTDCSIQVQLESLSDDLAEELQQLRDEVKMLRVKCQPMSGVMLLLLRNATCEGHSLYLVSFQ